MLALLCIVGLLLISVLFWRWRQQAAVVASMSEPLLAIDTRERITLFNPALEKLSGFKARDVLGQPYKQVLAFRYERSGTVNKKFIEEALSGKRAYFKNHTVLVHKSGRIVHIQEAAAPLRSRSGDIKGAVVVLRNHTAEHQQEAERLDMVRVTSHQLSTPLAAIDWCSELLITGPNHTVLDDEQRELLADIQTSAQLMKSLIRDLLDASHVELNQLPNQPRPVLAGKMVETLQHDFQRVKPSSQELRFEVAPDEQLAPILIDPTLLYMVTHNLVSNAIKYTPETGAVDVALHPAKAAEKRMAGVGTARACLTICVHDTGFGIPKAQQSMLFQKFFRADNARKHVSNGTGLGLYIINQIVTRLGGKVWFTSEENKGTTFIAVIPSATQDRSNT